MHSKISWTDANPTSEEDVLLRQALASGEADGTNPSPPKYPPAEIVTDDEAERAAFTALIALLNATDDGDPDTIVSAITAEEFTNEAFSPVSEESPS